MSEENKTIAGALLEAQRSAEAVTKSSKNKHHGFNYASAESMIAGCRDHLHTACLAVYGGDQEVVEVGSAFVLRASYVVSHESGASVLYQRDLVFEAGKGRPLDKALLGAATESLGYFLRDLLLIPRQEVDVSGRDDSKHAPRKPSPGRSKPKTGSALNIDVAKALGWIADCNGEKVALDECSGMIRDLNLTGDDRKTVVDAFKEARNG